MLGPRSPHPHSLYLALLCLGFTAALKPSSGSCGSTPAPPNPAPAMTAAMASSSSYCRAC